MARLLLILVLGVWACSDGTSSSSSSLGGAPGTSVGNAGSHSGGSTAATTAACVAMEIAANADASAISGTLSGPDIDLYVCSGAAYATMRKTASDDGITTPIVFHTGNSVGSTNPYRFTKPTNAGGASISVTLGMAAATPGIYSSSGNACGSVRVCVDLIQPDGMQCPDVTGACIAPWCQDVGSAGSSLCEVVAAKICYVARAASSCTATQQDPIGSFTLNLSAAKPWQAPLSTAPGPEFVPHGTIVANLVEEQTNAGTVDASLSLSF